MMYGITMYVDGALELFNITDSMVEGILTDIKQYESNVKLEENDKYISINHNDYECTYYYDRELRKDQLMSMMGMLDAL